MKWFKRKEKEPGYLQPEFVRSVTYLPYLRVYRGELSFKRLFTTRLLDGSRVRQVRTETITVAEGSFEEVEAYLDKRSEEFGEVCALIQTLKDKGYEQRFPVESPSG